MATVAAKVPFAELAGLLEKISERKGTDNKKSLLRKFIDQWRNFHKELHKDDKNVTDSFYPAMRLLLPQLEKEREAYGIKEKKLATLYVKLLGLNKTSVPAQKLMNFKSPKNAKADAGDFASVAYYVLKPRCPDKSTLTLEDVNTHLDSVARNNAAKRNEALDKSMLSLMRDLTALEQKWLIRMILKELKTGLSQNSVFSVFHQDAEDLFNVKMSLEKVCTMLHNPDVRMHEIEVSLFSPFRPMLGDRGAPNKVEKLFDGKSFFIETKFDGERMQLHKKGDEYKYFSRGGNDYTKTYGATSFDGNLTPRINTLFMVSVKSCIIDGEMVGYDPETKTIGSKGENFDIKSANIEGYQPCLCVFDILLLNDKVLTNKSLRERKEILKTILTPEEGNIMFSEYKEGSTREECVAALNDAIDAREEGIMVKNPDSVYKPNVRKGGWYKMKPEYVGGLMDELDVVVVGGYFGVGARQKLMSHFLCAVAVTPETGDKPTVFHSFCRVGSGYTRNELQDFNQKLMPHWQILGRKKSLPNVHLASGLKQLPDAWIDPSKSYILQIKAAEIIDSDQFKTGCTLRFPRVEKIRDDKKWFECMTTTELDDLKNKSEGKLFGRHAEVEDDEEPTKKKRRVVSRHVRPTVGAQFRGIDASSVTKVSESFNGKEICVVNGTSTCSKAELEKKIVELGGSIVQNPSADTLCVLADKVAIKVKNIIRKGLHDVVKADWFLRCADQERFISWVPSDMIYTKLETANKFSEDFDDNGDSFFEDTDENELKKVFKKMKNEDLTSVSAEDIADIEMTYYPDESPLGLFRLCRVYLDKNVVPGDESTSIKNSSLEVVGLDLRLHGATLVKSISEASHVVIEPGDFSRLNMFKELNRKRTKRFHIVTSDWVTDCIDTENMKSERAYDPPNISKT